MAAFYDESGIFNPGQSDVVSIGMVVIPLRYIRECNDSWWEMLSTHFPKIPIATSLPLLGIEASSSDLYDMLGHLYKTRPLKKSSHL
jgi:hypothetical protein